MKVMVNLTVLQKIVKSMCKTFSVPIKRELVRIDREGNKTTEFISYKIKFIDSMRFMATSLSNLIDNLTGEIHKLKCKNRNCFPEYKNVENSLIGYNCSSCNKDFSIEFYEELKNKFRNTFEFSKHDTNKFILLLRKGMYRYEYMDDWEKFSIETLPEKKEFYNNLSLEHISEEDNL